MTAPTLFFMCFLLVLTRLSSKATVGDALIALVGVAGMVVALLINAGRL